MDIKEKLKEIALLTDQRLEQYWDKEIDLDFGFNQNQKDLIKEILLHAKEHNLRKAKRIRAIFVYYAYLLDNEPNEEIFKAMMAIELIHTALLIHDDMMDQDEVRRGLPTTHVHFSKDGDNHFGASMACCLEDAVMTLGYELFLKLNFEDKIIKEAMLKLLRGITQTAYGQTFDVHLEKVDEWTENDVITLHSSKTAIYTYENPLIIGGILGKLEKPVLDILSRYAMDGGVEFQLQDDILGIFGDEEKTGKSSNSDLIHGKRTLLILKTLELGTEKQKQDIKNIWGKGIDDKELVEKAKKAIIDSGSLEYSKKLIKVYAEKSIETAKELYKFNLKPEAIEFLIELSEYLANREV